MEIKFTCTPIEYFNSLSTVLFTNDEGDLGGKAGGLGGLLDAERVYLKNVVKKNGHFYVSDVECARYRVLLVECSLPEMNYSGYLRNQDFSENIADTLPVEFCIQQNMRVISQQSELYNR